MADLSVRVAGVELKNPIIAGAGPNTKNLDQVKRAVDAGCGAVVVRSLHLERVDEPTKVIREAWNVYASTANFRRELYSFQSTAMPALRTVEGIDPGFGGSCRVPTLAQWQEEVAKMVAYAHPRGCAIIASIGWCGDATPPSEVWQAEANAMKAAGVDAIELHTSPSPATQAARYIQLDPEYYLGMPIKSAKVTGLPIFPKLGLDGLDIVTAAKLAQRYGADGIVPVARWMSLNIDVEHPDQPTWRMPGYGGPWVVPMLAAYIYRMRLTEQNIGYLIENKVKRDQVEAVTVPIMPSGGVRSAEDVITYVLAGGSAVQMCSQILLEGYGAVGRVLRGMAAWMEKHSFTRVDDFQGMTRITEPGKALTIPQAVSEIVAEKCNGCGICIEACTNRAISLNGSKKAVVTSDRCEGCRNCYYVCPTKAVVLKV